MELLVVIVILGILAAVVVFAIGGTQTQAKVSACQAEKATVETAYEAYKAQHDDAAPPVTPPGQLGTLVADGYLKRQPTYVTGFDSKGLGLGC